MIKWLIYLMLSIAALFLIIGFILIFTIFWLFIGLPLIVVGSIIALIVWFSLPRNTRKVLKRRR